MKDGKLDLNDLANRPDHQLSIVPREDPSERAVRHDIEKADAAHRRQINLLLHLVAFVVIGVALGLCVWTILRPYTTADDKKWATTLMTGVVLGLLGYITGRASK
ncbi:MAG: hypothetical protein ICV60_23645 [Pyrinomonadaceae bacterium]|nr:hypothetical protein [Pyrinomonadaceae bacterium]